MISFIRKMIVVFSLAGLISVIFKLRGTGGVAPKTGGWKEVFSTDLD